jgi:hypothetical protein
VNDKSVIHEVIMSRSEVDRLLEYSHSLPTGTIVGKQWKRRDGEGWILGTYIECSDPKYLNIKWERIVLSAPVTQNKPEKDGEG